MENPRLIKLFEFLENNPKDSFVLYAIATEYNAKGDVENALKFYQKTTENDPDYLGTYYHLGKLYEKLGQKELASTTYENGISLAIRKKDMHALSELRGVYNSLCGLDDEYD